MVNNDVVDSLEDRIKALELKVYGEKTYHDINTSTNNQISKTMKEANTVFISKLAGREKLTELLNKVDLIEKLLDPMFGETMNERITKMEVILQDEDKIVRYISQLNAINELSHVLKEDPFSDILQMQERTDKLSQFLIKNREAANIQKEKINALAKEYNETMLTFTDLFAKLDYLVTELEIKANNKEEPV